jgi:outer membrane translocation and assembly module TamA
VGGLFGPLTFEAKGFFGFADLEPKARLSFERESVKRRVTLGAYRELQATDAQGRYLGFGNSVYALLFGRDDGEYFMAAGADLVWRPPEAARQSFRFRAYAERQDRVSNNTTFALARSFDGDWDFRPNVEADRAEEAGGELHLAPWWGTDPLAAQVGLELYGHAATWRTPDSTSTENYARASAVLRIAFPLADATWRVGLEGGGGTSWGEAPLQRSWFLGGASTLRGYGAATLVGSSFVRGRLEVARVFPNALTVSGFGDAGWAGLREDFDSDDFLFGAGVGTSLLDGLIRFDLSHGLTGPEKRFRVDLYLDAIL